MKKYLFFAIFCFACGGEFAATGDEVAVDSGAVESGGDGGSGSMGGSLTAGNAGSDAGSGGVAITDAGHDGDVEASAGGEPSEGTDGASGSDAPDGDPGECSAGDTQCVDTQRQTCIGGIWLDNGAPCPGGCVDGVCTECRPGSRSCASDTQPQVCDESGSWTPDVACSGGKPWCSEGSCMGYCCAAGASHVACNESNPWTCYQGSSPPVLAGDCSNPEPCTVGELCATGAFTGTVELCP